MAGLRVRGTQGWETDVRREGRDHPHLHCVTTLHSSGPLAPKCNRQHLCCCILAPSEQAVDLILAVPATASSTSRLPFKAYLPQA